MNLFLWTAAKTITLPIFPGIARGLEWMQRVPEKVSSQLKQNSVRELMEEEDDTYSEDLQADFIHLQSFFI